MTSPAGITFLPFANRLPITKKSTAETPASGNRRYVGGGCREVSEGERVVRDGETRWKLKTTAKNRTLVRSNCSWTFKRHSRRTGDHPRIP